MLARALAIICRALPEQLIQAESFYGAPDGPGRALMEEVWFEEAWAEEDGFHTRERERAGWAVSPG